MNTLKDKPILVTAAGNGLGAAIAQPSILDGTCVVLADIDPKVLQAPQSLGRPKPFLLGMPRGSDVADIMVLPEQRHQGCDCRPGLDEKPACYRTHGELPHAHACTIATHGVATLWLRN